MSGLFGGGGGAQAEAARQQREARKAMQRSNEDAGRTQQRAERQPSRSGRSLLIGNISRPGSTTLGGA